MSSLEIRDIWYSNFEDEMLKIDLSLYDSSFVAFDTEFPGFLRNTPRNASEDQRYNDLKFNVDAMKLIQLGLTLFDERGHISGCWQINFRDFNLDVDPHVKSSIDLLKKNGIDFEKNKKEGINMDLFMLRFREIMSVRRKIKWVTFHGLYDLGYMLNAVTNNYLPNSSMGFSRIAGNIFGSVYDIKLMARYCDGLLGGELGLERIASILGIERVGVAHQAGSDSLLTARVLLKMKEVYGIAEGMFEGLLYGINVKIEKKGQILVCCSPIRRYYAPAIRCPSYYAVPCYPVPPPPPHIVYIR